MPSYQAPVQDFEFLLFDVFGADRIWSENPELAHVDRDLAMAILQEAGKLAENELAPINASGDAEGCRVEDGRVRTPAGFREAFATIAAGGWLGLSGDPAYGGQGMPKMLSVAAEEMFFAANTSLHLYPSLTAGATLCIAAHASEALKSAWLPAMYEGRFTGTMCLTESHAGSDLGLLRTRAEPGADGSHAITGTKIFITGGDQDLTENIVHLVLARLPMHPRGPAESPCSSFPRCCRTELATA